ncbi:MAG: hypothetical protein U5K00_00260 [Melioribacteraceae bacterium]|nr:hypothetical protein [Melioribacteraceae bacterium]
MAELVKLKDEGKINSDRSFKRNSRAYGRMTAPLVKLLQTKKSITYFKERLKTKVT